MKLDKKQKHLFGSIFSKVISNIAQAIFGFIFITIVPRAIGPAEYGIYNYVININTRIMDFLKLGVHNAFYIKLSKRKEELALIWLILVHLVISVVGLFVFIYFGDLLNYIEYIFPQIPQKYIYWGFLFVFMTTLLDFLRLIYDALGITIRGEVYLVLQKVLGVSILGIFAYYKIINIQNIFTLQISLSFLLAFSLIYKLIKLDFLTLKSFIEYKKNIKPYFKEFKSFCSPLIVSMLFGLMVGLLDRWILQYFYDSSEQGFYSLSHKISAVTFLILGAVTNIWIREVSTSFSSGNQERLRNFYSKYIYFMYALTAYISCFVILNYKEVTLILGGEAFSGASVSVMIMAIYPIHQSLGQLSGSYFLASEQTKLRRNINIVMSLIGVILTYICIVPEKFGGLELGAIGLACKEVIVQILSVNVLLYYVSKGLKINFVSGLIKQVVIFIIFYINAVIAKYLIDMFKIESNIISFLSNGVLYSIPVMICGIFFYKKMKSLTPPE
jgi:O-antigen/teichoic acid export membrane protein